MESINNTLTYTIDYKEWNIDNNEKDLYIQSSNPMQGNHDTLKFTGKELLESILLCGTPDILLAYKNKEFWKGIDRQRRKNQILARINIVLDALQENNTLFTTQLTKSTSYDLYLDPTEKGYYSYLLGIIFTQLYVRKIHRIPYLLHYDLATFLLDKKLKKSRPDFIGVRPLLNSYEFSIWEAKGRSAEFSEEAMRCGLAQAMLVSDIHMKHTESNMEKEDIIKVTHNGCCQIFLGNPIVDTLGFHVIDPIAENEETITLDINQYFLMYYSQVMCFVDEHSLDAIEMIGEKPYIKVSIPYSDNSDIPPIRIKIPKELYDSYMLSCKAASDDDANDWKIYRNALSKWINNHVSSDSYANFLIIE